MKGEPVPALRHLQEGFGIAQRHAYRHFPVLSPEDLLDACLAALGLNAQPVSSFATRLAAVLLVDRGPDAVASLDGRCHRSVARCVNREIHRVGRPLLEIRTFGGFRVFREGAGLFGEVERSGRRTRLLLMAIVAHGGREVPKEVLLEDLWPESGPAAAAANFKVTLHRLRKALEPDLDSAYGSSYIHLRDQKVSLDPELCHSDVDRFLELCDAVRRNREGADPVRLKRLCAEAAVLYRGDFLFEEPYADWAEAKRTVLREQHLSVLVTLARVHEERGERDLAISCYQTAIQSDPLRESTHRRLMRLYAGMGMRSAAVRVYDDFKTRLQSEVGEPPDPTTTALRDEILAHLMHRDL
jgi:DNA-binding SARP family transcriptional activator